MTLRSAVSTLRAIVTAWLLCAILDIAAAFALSWFQAGRAPVAVLKGIASALLGRSAVTGGPEMAVLGAVMHLAVALTATLVFYALSRRLRFLRAAPLLIVGPAYGLLVFGAMKYGTLPLMSWFRSLYLGTPARWPADMGWPLVVVHLLFVGTPIVWAIRRAR